MRRAALAAGRRLAAAGAHPRARALVDAGLDEMCALLVRRGRAVGGRARRARRSTGPTHSAKDAPPLLGTAAAAAARPVRPAARAPRG